MIGAHHQSVSLGENDVGGVSTDGNAGFRPARLRSKGHKDPVLVLPGKGGRFHERIERFTGAGTRCGYREEQRKYRCPGLHIRPHLIFVKFKTGKILGAPVVPAGAKDFFQPQSQHPRCRGGILFFYLLHNRRRAIISQSGRRRSSPVRRGGFRSFHIDLLHNPASGTLRGTRGSPGPRR